MLGLNEEDDEPPRQAEVPLARYYAAFHIKHEHQQHETNHMKGWAKLSSTEAKHFREGFASGGEPSIGDSIALEFAAVFGFATKLENHSSQHAWLVLDELTEDEAGDHALGSFSLADELLTAGGAVQPHLAGKLGVFCGGGSTLSGRFFRDASCLMVATLEACYDGINSRRARPNPITASPEALYEFVTGKRVVAGEPMPVSLRQAEKAFAELHIKVTAIDHLGRVVYRYEGRNWARGRVLRLGVKNNHCWLVNDNVESFDHTYADKTVTDIAPLSTDMSSELSTTWPFAP